MLLFLTHFVVQTRAAENDTIRVLFIIAMLGTVLWWSVQKLLGRERGNEVILTGLWKLVKALVVLPFKLLRFVFRMAFGNKHK